MELDSGNTDDTETISLASVSQALELLDHVKMKVEFVCFVMLSTLIKCRSNEENFLNRVGVNTSHSTSWIGAKGETDLIDQENFRFADDLQIDKSV